MTGLSGCLGASCDRTSHLGKAMQALALMGIYILTAAVVQFLGFLVSQAVDYRWPTASVLVFLVLFLAAYGIAWPIAVWIYRMGDREAGV